MSGDGKMHAPGFAGLQDIDNGKIPGVFELMDEDLISSFKSMGDMGGQIHPVAGHLDGGENSSYNVPSGGSGGVGHTERLGIEASMRQASANAGKSVA